MNIKSVERVEYRIFYDSTWKVVLEDDSIHTIVRDDLETEENLLKALSNAADIQTLNLKHKLFYD